MTDSKLAPKLTGFLDSLRSKKYAALALVLALVAVTLLSLGRESGTRTVTAHFSRAVSIYEGSEVRILGVNVGKVTAVIPEGRSVRVVMEYDDEYRVPDDAKAVIITPTLVADRFIQLAPVFAKGDDLMADGAEIPLEATGTPIELDRIYASLQDVSSALGPNGANKDGSLNAVLRAGARTLDGNGKTANQMILDMADAAEVFDQHSGDLFQTVENLDAVTSTLAKNDRVVDDFLKELSGAAGLLAGERKNLDAVLRALARALGAVRGFVKEHRGDITAEIRDLTDVLDVLVKNKDSLATTLEKGPLGANNLAIGFDPKSGSMGSRVQLGPNIADADQLLCAIVQNAGIPAADLACKIFEDTLEPLGLDLPQDGGGPPLPDGTMPGSQRPAQDLTQLLGGTP
ncbi:MAG: MCE family protein [Nocardioides sp.]|jgi:phospholipid/cholesterol/gamma-HCH transport system substrate-binding protein